MESNRIATKKAFNENNFNVAIATLDKKNPSIFFVEGSFYVRPFVGKPCEEDFIPIKNRYSSAVRKVTKGDTVKIFNTAMGKYDRADKVYVRYQYYIRNTENLSFKEILNSYDTYVLPVVSAIKESLKDNGYGVVERKKNNKTTAK